MDKVLEDFDAPNMLEFKGLYLFQKNLKAVAKPLIENVKIINNGNITEYNKNILIIRWTNEKPERTISLLSKKDDLKSKVGYWLLTKDLIELNGNILKLNNAIETAGSDISIESNQEVIVTLTDDGLKKFNNMLKKWV